MNSADITAAVQPVLATCDRLEEVIGGYTDGTMFYFDEEQMQEIAAAAGGQSLGRVGQQWIQRRPKRLPLTTSLIAGQMHYGFPPQWGWRPHRLPPSTRS